MELYISEKLRRVDRDGDEEFKSGMESRAASGIKTPRDRLGLDQSAVELQGGGGERVGRGVRGAEGSGCGDGEGGGGIDDGDDSGGTVDGGDGARGVTDAPGDVWGDGAAGGKRGVAWECSAGDCLEGGA